MMMAVLVFKTRCKEIYEKHYKVIRAMLKIIASAALFSMILYEMPFHEGLNYYAVPIVIVLSLFCGFIPDVAVLCLAAGLTIFEVSSVSLVAAILCFLVIVIYFLLFGRYTKVQGYIVVLIPALWPLNIAYTVPIIAALFLTPAMIPACLVGVLLRYVFAGVKEYYIISQNAVDTGNTMESLQYIVDFVMKSKEMLIFMVTFSLVYLVVFAIRKGRYNHASHFGIFAGLVICMAGVISGDIFWAVTADVNQLMIGLVFTALIAYFVQFFRMSLDYTGVRKLQFEDDEYFYYVKAVPKLKGTPVDKTVTRIKEDSDDVVIDLKDEIEKVLEDDMNPDIKER